MIPPSICILHFWPFYCFYVLFTAHDLFKFSLTSSILMLTSLSMLIYIVFNSASGILVVFISFHFLVRISLVLSFGAYFFVFLFCLPFCVWLWFLGRSALNLTLVMRSFWCRCLVCLSGTIFKSPEIGAPAMFPMWVMYPSSCSWVLNVVIPDAIPEVP